MNYNKDPKAFKYFPIFIAILVFYSLSHSADWQTYITTNCADSGPGSLRQAIFDANAGQHNTVIFNIPSIDFDTNVYYDGGGVWTISPFTELPQITSTGTIIDGRSQKAYITGDPNPKGPEIYLCGVNLRSEPKSGFYVLNSSGVAIYDITVSSFNGNGIIVVGTFSRDINIKGCYVGLNSSGTQGLGNMQYGIYLDYCGDVTIGGTSAEERNIISGNLSPGIKCLNMVGTMSVVNCYIGTDRTGNNVVGNTRGIDLDTGNKPECIIQDNLISGNECNIYITGYSSVTIRSNKIGTRADGISFLSRIGGTYQNNILFAGDSNDDLIENNIIAYSTSSTYDAIDLGNAAGVQNLTRIRISSNTIFGNKLKGIGFYKADNPNGGIIEPWISGATITANTTVIEGTAPVNSIVEVFVTSISALTQTWYQQWGQAKLYLGSTTADIGGDVDYKRWTLTVNGFLAVGDSVTATSFHGNMGTSEFAQNKAVFQGPDIIFPRAITDLKAATGSNSGEIELTWTATGDDGMTGTASSYEIRYSTVSEIIYDSFNDSFLNPMWQVMTKGNADLGSTSESAGELIQEADGSDIWIANDDFRLIYTTITGVIDFTVKISSQQNTASNARTGIMIRNSTGTFPNNSYQLFSKAVGSSGMYYFNYDNDENGYIDSQNPYESSSPPYYIRITKTDFNLINFYTSTDGNNWNLKTSRGVSVNNKQLVGLFTNSNLDGTTSENRFEWVDSKSYGWSNGTQVLVNVPAPQIAGTKQSMTVTGLTPGITYFFCIRAKDDNNNLSDGSNSPSSINNLVIDPYTVTSTTDNPDNPPPGSLRWCMNNANSSSNKTISFNIPATDPGYNQFGDGAFIIRVTTPLPNICGPGTIINGSSQRTNLGDTNTNGPEVAIWGSSITWYMDNSNYFQGNNFGATNGLFISTQNVTIKELIISSFTNYGIYIAGNGQSININGAADNINIKSCYIGLDPTGILDRGNKQGGIYISDTKNITIGGANSQDRNVISGNADEGWDSGITVNNQVTGSSTTIIGNYIGTDRDATMAVGKGNARGITTGNNTLIQNNVISGNSATGIRINSSTGVIVLGNLIGTGKNGINDIGNAKIDVISGSIYIGGNSSDCVIMNNIIAYGGGAGGYPGGIYSYDSLSRRIRISSNSIFGNAGFGIDLDYIGAPGYGPGTSNNGIKDPWITSANTSVIQGTAPANSTVEIFISSITSGSGAYGQGKIYIGSTTTGIDTGNGYGNWSLALWSPYSSLLVVGSSVTATATTNSDGTSEFSLNKVVSTLDLYTITTTADDPDNPSPGSLRWCMNNANKTSDKTITFNIPTTDSGYNQFSDGAFIISVTTPLPNICGPGTTIDGSTQRINKGDTNTNGPEIAIWGSSITWVISNESLLNGQNGAINGISISTQNVTIRELVISSFSGTGILINGSNANNGVYAGNINIKGCYIGLDPTGTLYRGNIKSGIGHAIILNQCSTVTIGGLDSFDRNVISGQTQRADGYGISADNVTLGSVTVLGNYIGVDKDAGSTVKNSRGIYQGACNNMLIMKNVIAGNSANIVLSGSSATVRDNFIGTDKTGVKNLNAGGIYGGSVLGWSALDSKIINNFIRFTSDNGYGAISLDNNSRRIRISSNSITNNAGEAINLIGSANNAISSPCITSANTQVITGTAPVNSIVEVFISSISSLTAAAYKNFGQGLIFIGSTTADAATAEYGNWSLTLWSPYTSYIHTGDSVTATAYQSNNGTSKFSLNKVVSTLDLYTVTTTNDNPDNPNPGSLRWCMNNANLKPSTTIIFNIPIADPGYNTSGSDHWWEIRPSTPLPPIMSSGTYINGSSQKANIGGDPNSRGPEIEICGGAINWYRADNNDPMCGIGLFISSNYVTVDNLIISSFTRTGIAIKGITWIRGCTIKGCYIGTNFDATVSKSNGYMYAGEPAVEVYGNSDTIGGPTPADRNIISGHKQGGAAIFLGGSTTTIRNNYIGVDRTGTVALANSGAAIIATQYGGNSVIQDNIISGNNSNAIQLDGEGMYTHNVLISGNLIGCGLNNTKIPNNGNGIYVGHDSSSQTITNNVIAYNVLNGIVLENDSKTVAVKISSNSIFANTNLGMDLGYDGVGNSLKINGGIVFPWITSANTTLIQGTAPVNSLIEVFMASITAGSGNYGQGAVYIGSTTADGSGNWSLNLWSPYINFVTIGSSITSTATDPQNNTSEFSLNKVVSTLDLYTVTTTTDNPTTPQAGSLRWCINNANLTNGVTISFNIPVTDPGYKAEGDWAYWQIKAASSFTAIMSSGTWIDGMTQTNNKGDTNPYGPEIELTGVNAGNNSCIKISSDNVVIRGLAITKFSDSGIRIEQTAGKAQILGNYLGVCSTGTLSSGNGSGIMINGSYHIIGTWAPNNRNIISGNNGYGIYFGMNVSCIDIKGNYIGTDRSGALNVGNNNCGIFVWGSSCSIGGVTAAEKNVISCNNGDGIRIANAVSYGNKIFGNYIGTDLNGTQNLGNNGTGVAIANGASNNIIGGINPGEKNIIAYSKNSNDGIWISSSTFDPPCINNKISGNYIFNNGGLGIDLWPDGVTFNDSEDGTGANKNMNTPVIQSASFLVISGTAPVNSTVELFVTSGIATDQSGYGEGRVYIGSVTANSSGNWSYGVSGLVVAGDSVTATATDVSGNTSEFSFNVLIASGDATPPGAITFLAAVPGVSTGTIILAWSSPGDDNYSGTLVSSSNYAIQLSSWSNYYDVVWSTYSGNTVVISTKDVTAGATQYWEFDELQQGVTYYFRVWTADEQQNWSGISLGATSWAYVDQTIPVSVTFAYVIATSSDVIITSCTASDPESGLPANPFWIERSTDNIFWNIASGWVSSHTWTGLTPDTTSWFKFKARNNAGLETGFMGPQYAVTWVNPPVGSYIQSVSSWSVNIAWDRNGDPLHTVWGIIRSSDDFTTSTFTLTNYFSGWSTNTYKDITNIEPDTTYYYKVQAYSIWGTTTPYDIKISTRTILPPSDMIAPGAITFLAAMPGISTGTIILAWSSTGDDNYSGTLVSSSNYAIQVSSWIGVAWSTWTADTVVISTKNVTAGTTQYRQFNELQQGVTYYFRVWTADEQQNWSGVSLGATSWAYVDQTVPISVNFAYVTAISSDVIITSCTASDPESGLPDNPFWIERSTDNIFWNIASGWVSSHTWTGLTPDTTSWFKFKARNNAGLETGFMGPQYAVTWVNPPVGSYIQSVSSWSVNIGWNRNGDPLHTVWGIIRSSDDFTTSTFTLTNYLSGWSTNTYKDITNIEPDTTYYYKVQAYSIWGTSTPFDIKISTLTKSAGDLYAPTGVGFVNVTVISTSVIVTTCTAVDNESGLNIYPFYIERSSDGITWGNYDSSWIVSSFTWTGLDANTTSWFRIKAKDAVGNASPYLSTTTAVTFANPPSDSYIQSVSSWTININWSRNSNPTYTYWGVIRSTDNFVTSTNTMSDFSNELMFTSFTDISALPDTTYYYKVRGFNVLGIPTSYDNIVSTRTLPLPPDMTAPGAITSIFAAPGASTGTINLAWVSPGDDNYAGNLTAGSQYAIQRSSWSGVYWSTGSVDTLYVSTSAVVPGTTQYYRLSGLQQGVTYYIGIWTADEVLNWSPISLGATSWAFIDPTPPSGVGFAYVTVISSDIIITSGTATDAESGLPVNPFLIQRSTDNSNWNYDSGWISSYTWTGLTPNTTNWFRIKAVNNIGNLSSYYGNQYAVTLANPPTGAKIVSVSSWTVDINWLNNDNPPIYTRYGILRSTDDFKTSTTTIKNFASNYIGTSFTDNSGLLPNSSYFYKVQAFNESAIPTIFDLTISTLTSSIPDLSSPTAVGFTDIFASSPTIIITTGTAVDTEGGLNLYPFWIQRSTSILAPVWYDSGWVQSSHTWTGLTPNTTNWFRIKARDSVNNQTTYLSTATAVTLAYQPAGSFIVSASSSDITVQWSKNNNPDYTKWGILRSTDDFITTTTTLRDYNSNLIANSLNDTGLNSDTTYYYKIYAYNEAGIKTALDAKISTMTLKGPDFSAPVAVGFSAVGVTSTTVIITTGTAIDTNAGLHAYPFYIQRSTDSMTWGNYDSGWVQSSHTWTGLASNTTSWFRLKARDNSFNESVYLSTVSAVTFANKPAGSYVVSATSYSVLMSWTQTNQGYTRYGVIRSTDNFITSTTTMLNFGSNLVGTSFDDYQPELKKDTSYYYKVLAYNEAGIATEFDTTISTLTLKGYQDTTPPGAVTDLSAVTGTIACSINLSWTAPGNDGYSAGTLGAGSKFAIQRSTFMSVYWSTAAADTIVFSTSGVNQGSLRGYLLSNLYSGVTYYTRIWSCDEMQLWSPVSSAATSWAQIDTPPNAPSNLMCNAVSNPGGISDFTPDLSWAFSDPDPGDTQSAYQVIVASNTTDINNDAGNMLDTGKTISTSNTLTYAGLTLQNGVTYYWKVRTWDAYDGAIGPYPSYATFSMEQPAAGDTTPPGTITGVSAVTGTAGGSVDLTWTVPGNDGYSGALGAGSNYALQRSTWAGVVWSTYSADTVILSTSGVNPGSTVRYTLGGLADTVVYYIRIWACDEAQNWNSMSAVVSAAAQITPDTNPPGTVADLSAVTGANQGEIIISWSAPSEDSGQSKAIQTGEFRIQYSTWPGVTWSTASAQVSISTSNVTIGQVQKRLVGSLNAGVVYYFKVWSADEVPNWSAPSNTASASTLASLDTTAPSAVNNLSASAGINEGEVLLGWTAPGDDAMSGNINGGEFRIQYSSLTSGVVWSTSAAQIVISTTNVSPGSRRNYNVSNLSAGVTYYFTIWTRDDAVNYSAVSNNANSWAQVDAIAPSAVSSLAALPAVIEGEMLLTWPMPGDNALTGTLQAGSKVAVQNSSWAAVSWDLGSQDTVIISTFGVPPNTNVTYKIVNLYPGVTYYARLWVSDDYNNWSGISNQVNICVLDSGPQVPGSFSVVSTSKTRELFISWTKAREPDIREYKIYRSTFAGNLLSKGPAVKTVDYAQTNWLDTGLINYVTYYYQLVAFDYTGHSSNPSAESAIWPLFLGIIDSDQIKGKVTQSNGTPLAAVLCQAVQGGAVVKQIYTNIDGEYLFAGLAENTTYMVYVHLAESDKVSVVYREAQTGIGGIDFTLEISYQLGTITGFISGYRPSVSIMTMPGNPDFKDPRVYMTKLAFGGEYGFVEISNLQFENPTVLKVPVDSGGRYEIPNLMPGKYSIKGYNGKTFSKTQEITLKEGEVLDVKLGFIEDARVSVSIYPNPSKIEDVTIQLKSVQPLSRKTIKIYNVTMEMVREAASEEITLDISKPSYTYKYEWNRRNNSGAKAASGVYFCVIEINGSEKITKKLAIIR